MASFISLAELTTGHRLFNLYESRAHVYPRARGRIEAAIAAEDVEALTDAVWPFLRSWNWTFYRFRPELLNSHPLELHDLLLWFWHYRVWIDEFRQMTIEAIPKSEEERVIEMFNEFDAALGPVGAAKVLHVLAPDTFPLWDRSICRGYGVSLLRAGKNGKRYWRFLRLVARKQCLDLRQQGYIGSGLLKRIDERNYVTFTLERSCC
jgi:hypothetical protein